MKKLYSILLVFSLAFSSCEYSPSEIYYQEVAKPEADPKINIVLDETKVTSFRGEVNLSYKEFLDGKTLKSVTLYLDDKYIATGYYSYGSGLLKFDSKNFDDGPHKLTIQLITTTNTNSLASKLNAESYVLRKEYNTYIFNGEVKIPQIEKSEVQDGALKLTWQKYSQPGFQKYLIRRDDYYKTLVGEVSDINRTFFFDEKYAGTPASYIVETIVGGVPFRSGPHIIDIWKLNGTFNLNAEIINESSVKLLWNKTVFTKGFKSYVLHGGTEKRTIININDTCYVDLDPGLGGELFYSLNIEGRDGRSWEMARLKLRALGYDTPIYFPYKVYYIPQKNLLYIYGNTYLFKLDATTMQVTASRQIPAGSSSFNCFSVSDDGDKLYFILEDFRKVIVKLNPENLEITNTYYLSDITGLNEPNLTDIAISDNNILFGCIKDELIAIDMNTNKLIAKTPIVSFAFNFRTVPDGRYVIYNGQLYKLYNNEFHFIGNVEQHSIFSNDFTELIQVKDGNRLQRLRLNNLEIVDEFEINTSKYSAFTLYIDKASGFLGISNNEKYFIIDLKNKIEKKVFKISDWVTFVNGKIIFSGKYVEVEFGG